MAITYNIENDALYQKGIEKGIEKGLEQGLEQGLEKGLEQGLEQGLEKGLEKGIEKGIKQNTLEIASNMKKAGFSTDDIIKATGLTKEQIDKIS